MSSFKRVLGILVILLVLHCILAFVLENQQVVSLRFFGWVVPQFPVSVFIVAALLLGMTVGPLVGWIASRTIRARRRKHLA